MSRHSVLALSVILSLAFHGVLLAVSPTITILRRAEASEDMIGPFRVRVVEESPPEQVPPREETPELAYEPKTLEDLLDRETQSLKPAESLLEGPGEIPLLAERLASEKLEREYELELDESILNALDTKIVEIAREEMREEVQVARRVVRPSSTRILDEDILPTLRGEAELDREEVLLIQSGRVGGGGAGLGGEAQQAGQMAIREPEPPALVEGPESEAPEIEIPPAYDVARLPVEEEIRGESRDYQFMDDLVDIHVETFLSPGEELGYFKVQIAPKSGESIEILPKDVTFVVDASSSILQRKLDRAVTSLLSVIDSLRPQDRFNVVVFRDTASMFRPELTPATPDQKKAAKDFIKGLRSHGETDVYAAIRPVIESRPREGVPGIVVLVTDGRPTAGLRDARTIINTLTDHNPYRNAIYGYGAGQTVNQYLLDLLAYRNKGESFVSPDLERIQDDLPQFLAQLDQPILVDCRVDFGRIDEEQVFPQEMPDFYRGQVVTVYGRFDPKTDKEFAMRLVGQAGSRKKETVFQADLSHAARGTQEIARDWAFRKIYHLIGEMCRVGETPEFLEEIRSLSKKYNVRTSYD